MSVIIVSADYFGSAIESARCKEDVTATQMSRLFGCDVKQLHRYEKGTDLIPRDVLKRVFRYAAKMDAVLEKE